MPKDLIVLVSDKNMAFSFKGILESYQKLNIRPIAFDILVHPDHDPGCLLRSHQFLRPFINKYNYAIVSFDKEGSGRENDTKAEIQSIVQTNLNNNGWADKSHVVVMEPELENWVWSDSPQVANALGWKRGDLLRWFENKPVNTNDLGKPVRPKEIMEEALRVKKIPRSSSIYQKIAKNVSFKRCQDESFLEFKEALRNWFPQT